MKKTNNILIINSSLDNFSPLFNLFEELAVQEYSFYLLSSGKNGVIRHKTLNQKFQEKKWPTYKAYFGPRGDNLASFLLFVVLLPFNYFLLFFYLAFFKFFKKIDSVLCLDLNEKIITTPIARILKLRVFWLETPDFSLSNKRRLKKLLPFYKFFSKVAVIISYINLTQAKLKKAGIKEKNIKIIRPGIKLNQGRHQDDIFSEIAQAEGSKFKTKFFTIGTIVELNKEQNIEILFQAAKTCLSIIPNMQIIIVGEGEERKNLSWLAKKMEIDNLSWFVGEQAYLKKWLDSFDVFAAASQFIKLRDLEVILETMAAGVPIIGPAGIGLEDIIYNDKQQDETKDELDLLASFDNSEMLARKIIKIYKDKRLRGNLGRINRRHAEEYFTMERQVENFKKII